MGSSAATKFKSRPRCPEKRRSRLPGAVVGGDLMEKHLRAPHAPRRPWACGRPALRGERELSLPDS